MCAKKATTSATRVRDDAERQATQLDTQPNSILGLNLFPILDFWNKSYLQLPTLQGVGQAFVIEGEGISNDF